MASLNLPAMDSAVHDQDTGNGMDSPPIGFSRPHVNVPASHVSSGGDASIRALTVSGSGCHFSCSHYYTVMLEFAFVIASIF